MDIKKIQQHIQQQRGVLQKEQQELKALTEEKGELQTKLQDLETLGLILNETAQEIQSKLAFHLEQTVQQVLDTVFPEEQYVFKLEFVSRRNRTEVDIYLEKDGYKYDVLQDNGGGLKDILSTTLRVAVWGIQKTDNLLVLDEPCRQVSKKYIDVFCEILKVLVEQKGLQILLSTHTLEFAEIADKCYVVTKENGVSTVREGSAESVV